MTPAVAKALEALEKRRAAVAAVPMRQRFAEDPGRFAKFSLSLGDFTFDYSKNLIDDETLALLIDLAAAAGVEERRAAMFAGEAINTTENRPALHVALRAPADATYRVEGRNVVADVQDMLGRMAEFAGGVRSGTIAGAQGPFTDVVNIGIGGSDLGPAMATRALAPYHDGPRAHFVSNVDGVHIRETLAALDPARTLFLVSSKSFTTTETMTNAASARAWIADAIGEDKVGDHFVAISSALDKVAQFGIRPERTFGFWDWVGGRYSVWSAIGLSLMIAVGPARFREFLDGGRTMDDHFRSAALNANMPVIMAMIGVWCRNVMGYAAYAVLPYDQRLERLPAYLQQLDMESNGKHLTTSGEAVTGRTGPIVFGEPGTNGQHAFYQLLHQGTDVVPCDFLAAALGDDAGADDAHHHMLLVANCLAQSEALMRGKTLAEVRDELAVAGMTAAEIDRLAPHKVCPGNRPSNTLLYRKLDPRTLGMIIALYEHKIFVQGTVWGIDSFDQWGVELGKTLAKELLPMVESDAPAGERDASTAGLIATIRTLRGA